jgi:hypothetical protein
LQDAMYTSDGLHVSSNIATASALWPSSLLKAVYMPDQRARIAVLARVLKTGMIRVGRPKDL